MEIRDGSTSLRDLRAARFALAALEAHLRHRQGRFRKHEAGEVPALGPFKLRVGGWRYRLELERIDARRELGRVRLLPPDRRHGVWIPLAILRHWIEKGRRRPVGRSTTAGSSTTPGR